MPLLGLVLALLLWHTCFDPDIWFHLFLGRRMWELHTVQPPDLLLFHQKLFVNVYWFFQLVCASFYKLAGLVGINLLFMAAWFAIFALWLRTSRARKIPVFGVLLACASIACWQLRFVPRPEVFSFLCLSVIVFYLARWSSDCLFSRRELAILFAAELLWANSHGYFPLGIIAVGLRLASYVLESPRDDMRRPAALRNLSWCLGLLVLASCVSPYGAGTWGHVANYWRLWGAMENQELYPSWRFHPLWAVKIFFVLWMGSFCLALARLARWKDFFPALLALGGLALSARSFRNIPLLPMMVAPLWALSVDQWSGWSVKIPAKRALSGVLALLCLVCGFWIVKGGYQRSLGNPGDFGVGPETSAYPVHAIEYLKAMNFRGKLFNDSSDGGYLEFHLPEIQIAGDSLFTDPETTNEYFAAMNNADSFARLDARHSFDALLLNVSDNRNLVVAAFSSVEWRPVYADFCRIIFVRTSWLAGKTLPPASGAFYEGQNLRKQWTYGMNALYWVMIASAVNQRPLLMKVIDDLSVSPALPAPMLRAALDYAQKHKDVELLQKLALLQSKSFEFR